MKKFISGLLLLPFITNAQFVMNGVMLTPQAPTTYINAGTVVVSNKSFTNLDLGVQNGNNIKIEGTTNITFNNCYIGPSVLNGISAVGASGTIILNGCLFVSNRNGVHMQFSTGNIQIDNCEIINPWGAIKGKGQLLQIQDCTSSNSFVTNCRMENFWSEGSTEDWVSFFNSNGISGNPLRVAGCLIRGGGPSPSGGGLMTGDHGGSWQLVEDNKLMNPGNYLLAVSGGSNITVRNNMAYQDASILRYDDNSIACYAYKVEALSCSDITFTGNHVFRYTLDNYWYVPGGPESCGSIAGSSFTGIGNFTDLTLAELAFPDIIITSVDEDKLWHLREESLQFRDETSPTPTEIPVLNTVPRPTSIAGSDQSISISSSTFAGSATSTNGASYRWKYVSGPNTPTITTPTSATSTVTGLISGVYEFRLEVTDDDGAADADWMTITVSGVGTTTYWGPFKY